jgi:transcriptional regulator with XRE-family HTH domain
MEPLWLKSQKLSHEEICRLTGISSNTLRRYLREYQRGGIEALKELNVYQPQSELNQHTATIEAYFREHAPSRQR